MGTCAYRGSTRASAGMRNGKPASPRTISSHSACLWWRWALRHGHPPRCSLGNKLDRPVVGEFARWATVGGVATVVNLTVVFFLTEVAGFYYMVSSVFAVAVAGLLNFSGNKLWTFRKR